QHRGPGCPLKRMQFTFSVDQPANQLSSVGPVSTKKPDLKSSSQFRDTILRRTRPATRASAHTQGADDAPPEGNDKVPPLWPQAPAVAHPGGRRRCCCAHSLGPVRAALSHPFTNDFGPAALLFPQPSLANPPSYGEDTSSRAIANERFHILRPTIELPLDEILKDVSRSNSPDGWS
ncbi:hypothetical protein DFH11DRAFT_1494588, partial [Phellopilus nigrolimitatus]